MFQTVLRNIVSIAGDLPAAQQLKPRFIVRGMIAKEEFWKGIGDMSYATVKMKRARLATYFVALGVPFSVLVLIFFCAVVSERLAE